MTVRPFKIAGRIIIILWLVMIALLLRKNYFKPVPSLLHPELKGGIMEMKEEWMGIYLKGEKIGYSVSRIDKIENGYELREQAVIDLTVMGTPQRVSTTLQSVVNQDLSLKSFIFHLGSGVARFIVSGQVNGRKLALKVDTAGRKEEKVLELKDTPFLSYHVKPFLLSQGMAVGKRYRRQFFDPSTLSNNEVLLEVEGKEKMVSKKKEITAYRIRESFKGFTVTSWVGEDGETIQEESPLGFVLKSETKEEALSKLPEGRGTDIIELSAVPVSGLIGKPYPRYLKVRMKGIGFDPPTAERVQGFKVEGGRQKFNKGVLEITQEDLKRVASYPIPYQNRDLKVFCEPSLLIQSDDQVIVSEAKNIVGKERDAVTVVKMLLNWMHDNIEKRPTMSIPSAREVLKMRVGDCNEHAALFTAFARSLGIPARICGGIVYSRGSFYYHAWDEVFLQDWVSVDPLMNQFPADATHIKLVEGDLDKQLPLLGLLGKLKVEVVEYR